jgi:hypothetical protein
MTINEYESDKHKGQKRTSSRGQDTVSILLRGGGKQNSSIIWGWQGGHLPLLSLAGRQRPFLNGIILIFGTNRT